MFALEAYPTTFASMTELKAELTVGNNAPIDVYFGQGKRILSGWKDC
jgi:hypothetical protein